jgi:predicted nucleotidyltransferase component of viral defense system
MYSKQQLATYASDLGFVHDMFEKVYRLTEIMKLIESDPLLHSGLALKGDAAINLTIFNLPRLFVDIDFDYAHDNSLDDMLRDRMVITDIIGRYMTAEGYVLSPKSKEYHSLDSFVYTFVNSAGIKDNIKIEINYSMRCHVLPIATRTTVTMGVFETANVLSVAPMEIFSSKIVALLTRAAARDFYDINNMVTSGLFGESEETMFRKMDENQKGCFLIKGAWGVGKTHFINDYARDFKVPDIKIKFVKISLFDKGDTSQIVSEINSKLISSQKEFIKKSFKVLKGVSAYSFGLSIDLSSFLSEKNQLEEKYKSKNRIVFIFDDLERTGIDIKDTLGYINNINENYGFKVIVLANTAEIEEKEALLFNNHREKIFYTEVLFSDNFGEISKDIIRKSKLKSYEKQIVEIFSSAEHNNLRTLIFAIQKIKQVLEASDDELDKYVLISSIRTILNILSKKQNLRLRNLMKKRVCVNWLQRFQENNRQFMT